MLVLCINLRLFARRTQQTLAARMSDIVASVIVAAGVGGPIAFSIWWAQRDRTATVNSHPRRRDEKLLRQIQEIRSEMREMTKDVRETNRELRSAREANRELHSEVRRLMDKLKKSHIPLSLGKL